VIGLVVVVVLTVVAIVWRNDLHRQQREIDRVTDAWRDEHLRERRDE
jgi:hypothetical protein